MRAFLAAGVLVVAGLGASATRPPAGWACSCAGESPATWLARSEGAFVGTVLDWRVEDPAGPFRSTGDPAFATFRVERAVKGTLPRELVVRTVRSGASCGLEVGVGQRVGLLLERRDGEWTSSLCAQFEAAELERLPAGGRIADAPGREAAGRGVAGTVAVGAAFAAAAALAWRARRRRPSAEA